MIKGYAIKKTVYEGADGVLVDSLKDTKLFNSKKDVLKRIKDGEEISTVIRPGKKPCKKSRLNQQWMRK